jgi:hypothetical protein
MPLRFRKTLKIAPGLRINLARRGASISVGGKGLTYNINKNGTRSTAGLPGSGLSYSTYKRRSGGWSGILWVLVIAALVFSFYVYRSA